MENEEIRTAILGKLTELFPAIVEIDDTLNREFGEENVDLLYSLVNSLINYSKTCDILENDTRFSNTVETVFKKEALVKFPVVDITNENNEKIRIYNLFVNIPLSTDGTFRDSNFKMIRSTYTKLQYINSYCHSHIPHIRNFMDVLEFKSPCLGSGPIKSTIYTLQTNYSPEMWGLFAYELKLYVQTESLKGGPYVRMSSVIGKIRYDSFSSPSARDEKHIDSFIKWICENNMLDLGFGFRKGSFKIGMSMADAVMHLSELFAKWHFGVMVNEIESDFEIKTVNYYMIQGILKDGEVYIYNSDRYSRVTDFVSGSEMFTFRGEPVKTELIEDEAKPNVIILIRPEFYKYIIDKFIIILNTYGKREERSETGSEGEPVKIII